MGYDFNNKTIRFKYTNTYFSELALVTGDNCMNSFYFYLQPHSLEKV